MHSRPLALVLSTGRSRLRNQVACVFKFTAAAVHLPAQSWTEQSWLERAGGPLPWTWASVRGRAEPPVLVLPAADPAAFLERHGAAHGPHLANVAAIAREVRAPAHRTQPF